MLRVENLTVRYGTGHDQLIAAKRVSLDVARGKTLGLVGESGSGKSTIARALVGLAPLASGSIEFDGVDFTSLKSRHQLDYRLSVQMVFQDPYASLDPRMTIGATISEALQQRAGAMSRSERRREVIDLLEAVGLGETALGRYPHQFSGGQRQRIAIARVLAVRPKLIIMDEVTSSLDVSVQAAILNLLKDLQREFDLSYLFISHDLAVVGNMSDSVAVLYLGEVVERADSKRIFERPQHPYTQALMASVPRLFVPRTPAPIFGDLPDPRDPPPGCSFHTRCPVGPLEYPDRVICRTENPQTGSSRRPHDAACHFAGPNGIHPGSPLPAALDDRTA